MSKGQFSMVFTTYVALLRGINVGGNRKIPMGVLSQVFRDHDCSDVQTYIQSGNVVFKSIVADRVRLIKTLTAGIETQFGFPVPMVLRSAPQIKKVLSDNPFANETIPDDRLHVMFLADPPDPVRVALLDPQRRPPDQIVCRGQEIYLWTPNGLADTKYTNAYIDSALHTISTARNWRTVNKLCGMMDS